jgi:hypothetical protein
MCNITLIYYTLASMIYVEGHALKCLIKYRHTHMPEIVPISAIFVC